MSELLATSAVMVAPFGLAVPPTASMNAAAAERLLLENSLLQAIDHHELLLHYQPLVDMASGAIVATEAIHADVVAMSLPALTHVIGLGSACGVHILEKAS